MKELKVLMLVDLQNVVGQARNVNRRADLPALREYLTSPAEGRRCIDAYLYASLPPTNGDKVVRWHDFLRHNGFVVVTRRAKTLPNGMVKANIDSLMVLDGIDLALNIRPDVVVIVSGDGDFAPLAQRLRRNGIRVEAACSSQCIAAELRAACNGFVDLDEYYNTCAAFNGDGVTVGTEAVLEALS